jgi:hypothetical protein
MKGFYNEFVISAVLIVLTVLFLDPFMIWMPDSAVYALIVALLVIFAVFAGFVWREKARDERDELHRMIAGRVGYLAGAGVIVLGVIYQTLFTHPDPWLILALLGMVFGKLASVYYSRKYH